MATAIDPICQMDVDTDNPPGGQSEHDGTAYYFCAPGCKVAFDKEPEKYLSESQGEHEGHDHEDHEGHEGHDHGGHGNLFFIDHNTVTLCQETQIRMDQFPFFPMNPGQHDIGEPIGRRANDG